MRLYIGDIAENRRCIMELKLVNKWYTQRLFFIYLRLYDGNIAAHKQHPALCLGNDFAVNAWDINYYSLRKHFNLCRICPCPVLFRRMDVSTHLFCRNFIYLLITPLPLTSNINSFPLKKICIWSSWRPPSMASTNKHSASLLLFTEAFFDYKN